MSAEILFAALCAAVLLIMFIYYRKSRRRTARFITGTFTGLAALFLLHHFSYVIGMKIPLNIFNICGSAVLGVPFVIFLVILKFI